MAKSRKNRACEIKDDFFLMPLRNFLEGIKKDPRIRTTHTALYLTLYGLWLENNAAAFFPVPRAVVMQKAKISSKATWHQAIAELDEYGYLKYCPTRQKTNVSTVSLLTQEP
ncbi:hypothetical protein BCY91_10985 [Pelobium manganitolerans]|uniref:Transcriptional regulator n=1 Tax=Pelobium manganitolerans TaxID=1842495 RepID=A0A419S211_9SPHI|nr:hypothetical protein [Pelobium manganitolerans]RKD12769.1 hypothetical protein BCY91_10985 [Pelobium manganitolerans]